MWTGWYTEARLNKYVADPDYCTLNEEEIVALVQDKERADANQDDSDDEEQDEAGSKPVTRLKLQ